MFVNLLGSPSHQLKGMNNRIMLTQLVSVDSFVLQANACFHHSISKPRRHLGRRGSKSLSFTPERSTSFTWLFRFV